VQKLKKLEKFGKLKKLKKLNFLSLQKGQNISHSWVVKMLKPAPMLKFPSFLSLLCLLSF